MAYRGPPGFGPPQRPGARPAGIGFAAPPQTEPPPNAPPDLSYGSFGPRPNAPNPGPPPLGLSMPGIASVGPQSDHGSTPAGLLGWQAPKDSHKEGRPPSKERGEPPAAMCQDPGWGRPTVAASGSHFSENLSGGGLPPTRDKGANRGSISGFSAAGIVPGRQAEQGSSGPIYGPRESSQRDPPPQASRQPSGLILGMTGAPPIIGFAPPESGTGRSGYPPDSWPNSSLQGPLRPNTAGAPRATARKSSEEYGPFPGAKQKSWEGSRSRSRRSRTAADEKELLKVIEQFEDLLGAGAKERAAPRAPTGQVPGWERPTGAASGSRFYENPSGGGLPLITGGKGATRSSFTGPSAPGIFPCRQAEQGSSGPIYGPREPSRRDPPLQASRQPSGTILGMIGAPPLIGFVPPESGTGRSGYPPDSWSNSSLQGPPVPNTAGALRATARKSSEGHGHSPGSKQKSREGSRSRPRHSQTATEEKELLKAIEQFEALL